MKADASFMIPMPGNSGRKRDAHPHARGLSSAAQIPEASDDPADRCGGSRKRRAKTGRPARRAFTRDALGKLRAISPNSAEMDAGIVSLGPQRRERAARLRPAMK